MLHLSSLLTRLLHTPSQACKWLCPCPWHRWPPQAPCSSRPRSLRSLDLSSGQGCHDHHQRAGVCQPPAQSWQEPPAPSRHTQTQLVLTKHGSHWQLQPQGSQGAARGRPGTVLASCPHSHQVPSNWEHREPWPSTVRSQGCTVPSHCLEVPGFVLLCSPSRGGPGGLTETYRNSACCHELSPLILLNI